MKIKKAFFHLNWFIFFVLFLLGFVFLYFLYFRQRSQAEVYLEVSVLRDRNITMTAPYNWVPEWLEKAIEIGAQEKNPFGGLNALVLDKESYEGQAYGKYVYLLIKAKAIYDRSGVYLFKNKPLAVGTLVDFKLPKVQFVGLVTYIGKEKPNYQRKKIQAKILGRNTNPWIAEAIKVGSTIKNNKGEIIVKVIDKKISLSSGSPLTRDLGNRDVEVTVELRGEKNDEGAYYFMKTQKLKVNELLFLPFPEVALNFPIVSVSEP